MNHAAISCQVPKQSFIPKVIIRMCAANSSLRPHGAALLLQASTLCWSYCSMLLQVPARPGYHSLTRSLTQRFGEGGQHRNTTHLHRWTRRGAEVPPPWHRDRPPPPSLFLNNCELWSSKLREREREREHRCCVLCDSSWYLINSPWPCTGLTWFCAASPGLRHRLRAVWSRGSWREGRWEITYL